MILKDKTLNEIFDLDYDEQAERDFIGGKWKTVILFHLMNEKLRYNELRKSMPTVTERTLSLQLKALEEDGLIKRKVYTSKPPLKVEYSLTDFGKTLIPLIQSIADWGNLVVEKYS